MSAVPVMAETNPVRGQLRHNEPMARHTSWRVGGPADRFYRAADWSALADYLAALDEDEALLWVGLGSNLLVRDGGFRGTVIATQGLADRLERLDRRRLYVAAGVTNAKVARFAARAGLTGAEFLAGIPGTFGGALAMNAGAFGGETWDVVEAVDMLDRRGRSARLAREAFDIGYRQVRGPADRWFVGGVLQLRSGDADAGRARIRQLLGRRGASQPIHIPNAGSVFRNPPGDHAARLVEAAGLKGRRFGKACVSETHANFIVNTGGATARDIEQLIELVRAQVLRHSGVRLATEVRIVGSPS